ncbi:MAG: RNA-binding S4 domain-containing protein [Candidatus Omnitrophota bacterium]
MALVVFRLKTEFIELDNLLKAANLVENGARAKEYILSDAVFVNGQVERRIRRKLRPGDSVVLGAQTVDIIAQGGEHA